MVIALFDLKRRRVRICRAAHPQLLGTLHGKHLLIHTKEIGLGLEKGNLFQKELQELSRPLTKGSTYLLYSDGITEAMNDRREEYGDGRVGKIFERTAARSAIDFQNALLHDVEKFRGQAEQNDDITIVAVKGYESSNEAARGRNRGHVKIIQLFPAACPTGRNPGSHQKKHRYAEKDDNQSRPCIRRFIYQQIACNKRRDNHIEGG